MPESMTVAGTLVVDSVVEESGSGGFMSEVVRSTDCSGAMGVLGSTAPLGFTVARIASCAKSGDGATKTALRTIAAASTIVRKDFCRVTRALTGGDISTWEREMQTFLMRVM